MSLTKGARLVVTSPAAPETGRQGGSPGEHLSDHTHRKVQSMAKKLSLVLAAVAVLAFAIPAVASASKATLNGALAPVGTQITGTGSDVTLNSELLGAITCETLNLNGEITKNDGTNVEGSGTNVSPTQAGCKNGKKAVTVTKVVVTKLASSVSGHGVLSFTSKVDVGTLECEFSATEIEGTYVSGTNVLKAEGAGPVIATPSSCGNATLTGSFALESESTPLILD